MELNKIYCGDSLNLIKDLDINPKLIIMSPPDIAETSYNNLQEYKKFLDQIYTDCIKKLHENGVMVSITTDRKMEGCIYTKHIDIINILNNFSKLFNYKIWAKTLKTNLYIPTFCHILCFRKTDKITNNKIKEWYPDIQYIERDNVVGYKNKDSFPTKLIEIIVSNYTNEQDLVLDPFIGSGKTACVCKKLNRNYIGFEIDEKNVCIANERLDEIWY